ncbi:MAG: PKD domain-containing protein [Sphingobacteriales bacterium]|nr:PKD domain-containing protein [Sphingobacteriales bacterium]
MQRNTAANSHILYATTRTAAPEFYRSTDFGETWTLITSGISAPVVLPLQSGSRVAVTSADANVVYFAMVASGGIVYKSTDGGLNFVQTKAGGSPYLTFYADDINDSGQGDYNFCIGVDNVDANKIWLQSHNTWYSNNSGSTWSMLTHWASKVHTDMHQVGQSPYNSNHLYSCNDGGVWLSTDGGNNWTPKNDGLFAYEITDHSGKGSPTRKDFITIGTQDNGRLYADSTGWYTIGGGDDYTKRELDKRANSTAVYFIGDPAGFSVSGVGERRIAPTGGNTSYNLPGGVTIVEALAFNRTNNNLAFLGSSNIYRSNDVLNNTPTWTQISNFSTPIMHVHSCIANPNRLYVVTNDQKIYVSNDALSANPTFAMYNLPAASNNTATVTAISNNADIVYIAINNRVYRSADGGQNWANITYNLPSANHRRILAEEYDGTEELVLVATSNAVYYKKAGQVTWTNYSTNLPSRKSPTDFSMYDDGSNQAVIRYASYGRSIWETPFHNIRATRAVVAAATTNACSDATWKFADASTGDIASRVWSFTSGTPSNSTDAHPTVTYAATGTYNVTLTVTDALGNTASTMYQAIVNDLNKCDADTIPGNALSQSATTDYLLMNAPLNISTNTITFSAWVKPNGMQSSTTGLIMSGSNGATGIHLRNSNRLSYHWNNESGSYNFSGPTIPSDVWSHIAVVVTPSSATFYLNGVPTVRNASHVAVNFNSAFYIGNDRGNISRTFKGLMDEVCIYNRSLTTNEIREMMHLTKNPTADPNLLAYYQMNEPSGNLILNHAQTIHATLQGNATRNTSTAPVGGGLSERQGVASSGAKNFSTVGVILAFPNTGTLPNGDVVVTRLNVPPDQKPTPTIVPQNGYYIINNFGTNSTFETLTSIQFDNLPNIGSGYSTGQFGFYKRSSVADGNTWGSVAERADTFVPNVQNSSLTFSTGNNINNFSQFALTPTYATAGNDAWLCSGESVGIGDVPMSGLTYSWSPAAGLSATNISNPTASPTTTTTYTLTVTETASGMTFTDDVVVSIHSVPLLSAASITPTPASATVCGGGSVLMTASGGSAPAFVELGNGASVTTGNSVGSELGPNPLQNYYGGSKQQMLFTAAELHALGITTGAQLSGFGVNLSTAGTSYALNDLKISIQHTSLATLSTFVMSGWTTVRNAANYTPTAGWNTIPFNTNFTWDGLSNLLIEITYSNNNGGSGGTRNTAFFGTTNFVSTLFYRNDSQTSATIEAYSGAPSYSYSLRNNVRFALSGTTNYTWSPIAGLNAATGSNVTATPSTTTTYTVSATFSGACPATASQVVTVNANPSLSLAASCSGGPGTGVLTPTFVAGSGGTASYNPSTLTGLSDGNYTVTVTESPSGCTATASATINCTVQCPDLSAAAPAATVGSQSTCSNCALSGGTLAAPSGTCPTGSTLQYSTDGGTSWTATLPTYNQTTAMTILTRCNCNSDTNQSSPTSSVTTVPGVCTPVTATISGTATACDMVQLTASGGASYVWNGGASPSTAINTFSASGTYTVTVTGSNGCTASASQVVTVNANPSLSLAASCSGGPGTGVLTPTFVAGSGGTASTIPAPSWVCQMAIIR